MLSENPLSPGAYLPITPLSFPSSRVATNSCLCRFITLAFKHITLPPHPLFLFLFLFDSHNKQKHHTFAFCTLRTDLGNTQRVRLSNQAREGIRWRREWKEFYLKFSHWCLSTLNKTLKIGIYYCILHHYSLKSVRGMTELQEFKSTNWKETKQRRKQKAKSVCL